MFDTDPSVALAQAQESLAMEVRTRRLIVDLYVQLLEAQAQAAQLRQQLAQPPPDPSTNGEVRGDVLEHLDIPVDAKEGNA
jgi:hypothetical protein